MLFSKHKEEKLVITSNVRYCMWGVVFVFLVSIFAGCTSPHPKPSKGKEGGLRSLNTNGDLFRDTILYNKNYYINYDTGLQIQFPKSWKVYPYFYEFPSEVKKTARILRNSDREAGINGEIVLLANTKNQMLWLRIITEESNLSLNAYHQIIRAANKEEEFLTENRKRTKLPSGQEAILWAFSVFRNGKKYKFLECQIEHNGFNSRLTFWTLDSLMPMQKDAIRELLTNVKSSSNSSI